MKIPVNERLRAKNDESAAANRQAFRAAGLCVVNLLSSPGSGKTSLLEQTAAHLKDRLRMLAVSGDVETDRDAARLRAAGLEAIQIETHGACHLDARRAVAHLEGVALGDYDLLLIENVGNLVCPTGFDLGEQLRVVVASTTEGDDKPLKYPAAYHTADACVLNKTDLLAHVPFDVAAFEAAARQANRELVLMRTSCATGEGIGDWCAWLEAQVAAAR